jgi:hypothetical protein
MVCCGGVAFAGEDEIAARLDALEAATRGERGVSLKVSGQVNRVLMGWDDGVASDAYIADNIYSSSRVTLSGAGQAAPGFTAGFAIELELREVGTSTLTADNDEGSATSGNNGFRTRLAYGWVESEKLGRVSVGQLSPATNSLSYYNLWSIIVHTSPDVLYNTSFEVRGKGGVTTGLRWRDLASGLDSPRGDFVQYATPKVAGFRAMVDWGENDGADAALTFDGEFGTFALSAAAGWYRDDEALPATDVRFSALIRHMPSGLYVHGAYSSRNYEQAGRKTAELIYGHMGVVAPILPGGKTTVFAEAGIYRDIRAGVAIAAPAELLPDGGALSSSETVRLGAGVMQTFDVSGLEVYAIFQHYEAEARLTGPAGSEETRRLEPWQGIIAGSRLKF